MTAEDLVIRVSENSPYEYLLGHQAGQVFERQAEIRFRSQGHRATFGRRVSTGTGSGLYYYWCNSPSIPGISLDVPGGLFNLAFMLELALNNGVSRMTGRQVGLPTGDARKFTTYEQVWDAFCEQTRYFWEQRF
ncbi:MAG: pyruvate formate lyase family protein [Neglectibacter sp.]